MNDDDARAVTAHLRSITEQSVADIMDAPTAQARLDGVVATRMRLQTFAADLMDWQRRMHHAEQVSTIVECVACKKSRRRSECRQIERHLVCYECDEGECPECGGARGFSLNPHIDPCRDGYCGNEGHTIPRDRRRSATAIGSGAAHERRARRVRLPPAALRPPRAAQGRTDSRRSRADARMPASGAERAPRERRRPLVRRRHDHAGRPPETTLSPVRPRPRDHRRRRMKTSRDLPARVRVCDGCNEDEIEARPRRRPRSTPGAGPQTHTPGKSSKAQDRGASPGATAAAPRSGPSQSRSAGSATRVSMTAGPCSRWRRCPVTTRRCSPRSATTPHPRSASGTCSA